MAIIQNSRIEIYGKAKYTRLLNNLITKTRLNSKWFNSMVISVTKESPIKIVLVEGVNYKNRLYGKACGANVVLIFVDEMISHMYEWWKELLLCVTIHEIIHLSQSTSAYYETWRYIPLAERKMEQDADLMTWKTLSSVQSYMTKNTSLRMNKFMKEVAPHILDISTGEVVRVEQHATPTISEYKDLLISGICDELDVDVSDLPKLNIQIKDDVYELYNIKKNVYNYREMEFFFYYTEFFRIKHGKVARIRGSKHTFIYEYDSDIFKLGIQIIR